MVFIPYLILSIWLTQIIDSDDNADKDYEPPAKSPPPKVSTDDEIIHITKKKKTRVCKIYSHPQHIEIARTLIVQGQEGSAILVETY